MNTLADFHFHEGILGLFEQVAIICVVAWGIWALIQWAGWKIPEPIRIVAIVLFCIAIIIFLFKAFAALTG